MKRLGSSLLLLIFVLNVFGFYGLFMGARFQAGLEIRSNFDIEAVPEITFKVPLTLPYGVDTKEYQRVDGEFNYQGDVYRMVKQRLLNDTLYIVCIKDAQSKKIDKALEDYVKTFADNASNEKGPSKATSSVSKDYFGVSISIEKKQLGWEYQLQWPEAHQGKITSFQELIVQPPRA